MSELRAAFRYAWKTLEAEPHQTVSGLRRRYYWRGTFVLLEHMSAKAVEAHCMRLRRTGEPDHADQLTNAWRSAEALRREVFGRKDGAS